MQINDMQATSDAFDMHSERMAPQVSAVIAAAEGLPVDIRRRNISSFVMLLKSLLHPGACARMTAAQMHEMPWVKTAAAEKLPKSPISL